MRECIYIMLNPAFPNLVKIGRTSRDVQTRKHELSKNTNIPFDFEVVYREYVTDSFLAEQRIHFELDIYRVNANREFFKLELSYAIERVKEILVKYRFDIPQNSDLLINTRNREHLSSIYDSITKTVEELEERELYSEAILVLNNLVEIDKYNPKIFQWRGWLHWLDEKNDLAKIDYIRAISLGPDSTSFLRLAQICFDEKKTPEAIDYYSKAISLEESRVNYIGRGLCWRDLEYYTKAISDFTKAIELDGHEADTAPYFYRATCYFALMKFSESVNDLRTVILINPQHQAKELIMSYEKFIKN